MMAVESAVGIEELLSHSPNLIVHNCCLDDLEVKKGALLVCFSEQINDVLELGLRPCANISNVCLLQLN